MKFKAAAILLSLVSSSVFAEPLFIKDNWAFNPMIGLNVASEAHETAVPTVFSYGGEVFYKDKYFVGASYGADNKVTETHASYSLSVWDEKFTRKSLWAGYLFDNGVAAKLGMTAQSVRSNYDVQGTQWIPDNGGTIVPFEYSESNKYNTRYVMVGTGYYGENFNASVHYNIAASGEFNPYIKKSANNHLNVMIGYKF